MYDHYRSKLLSDFMELDCRVSLTADAWSSKIFRGYMVVTEHWIDHERNMNSVVLDFKRFPTPHSDLVTAALVGHVFLNWDLEKRLLSITTGATSDIMNRMKLLFGDLQGRHGTIFTTMEVSYVRCFSHVMNLAVRECLKIIKGPVANIKAAI